MKIKRIIFIIIILFLFIPSVNAKDLTSVEYIQKIADEAGGNHSSFEIIGDTGLAYDNTEDKNLRYIGSSPKNYVYFNDELWRIVGIMNNVNDSNGDNSPKLKIIRADLIGDFAWDSGVEGVNNGHGVNDWSNSSLNKQLNVILDDTDNTGFYFQRKGSFVNTGLKEKYHNLILDVVWNTGTILASSSGGRDSTYLDCYNYERGEARKCVPGTGTFNTGYCSDTVERKSTFTGKVGLIYLSDYGYSLSSTNSETRQECLTKQNTGNCTSWLDKYQYTMDAAYSKNFGITVSYATGQRDAKYGGSIYPVVYLETSTKIVAGEGTYDDPYIVKDASYKENTKENKTIKAKYKGNYSIEYLIKNYNVVTFGTKNNNLDTDITQMFNEVKKGDLKFINRVEGPVLVSGDYFSNYYAPTFATKSENYESFIKGKLGQNLKTSSKIVTNNDYVDFEKMYAQVTNEQQMLVNKTKKHINKEAIEVNEPGIYMINNTEYNNDLSVYTESAMNKKYTAKRIYINDYDPNEYYIFNIMKLFEYNNYDIYIKSSDAPSFMKFDNFVEKGNYTGNIIFNYPNARYIELSFVSGKIVAPKADVYLQSHFEASRVDVNESIYANSIKGNNIAINYHPSSLSKRILDESGKQYVVEVEDFKDDLYTGDYSLKSLLENYNVISFGKKDYDSKSKFIEMSGTNKGNVGIFHIASQFLINGDMSPTGQTPSTTDWFNTYSNALRLDKESNLVTESYLTGRISLFAPKYWTMRGNKPVFGGSNYLYLNETSNNGNVKDGLSRLYLSWSGSAVSEIKDNKKNFISFDRLYDNIVAQQKAIKQGQDVDVQNGKAHIKIGSNYVISNINDINEIVFDNFENNKNKLTVITIQNSGDINFPKMSADTIGLIETNDYYGKKEATYQYEINRDFNDKYHGNIIWNIPNATYIKLAANAPFAGHLIAPKADVESPETHFSGCFIVNSLYCEGNTEAHFYPLTTTKIDEYYIDKNGDGKTKEMDFSLTLGEETSILDYNVIGDYQQYLRDLKKNPIREILTNPKTYRNLGIVLFLLFVVGAVLHIYKKNKEMIK